jgi:hypothetical protein
MRFLAYAFTAASSKAEAVADSLKKRVVSPDPASPKADDAVFSEPDLYSILASYPLTVLNRTVVQERLVP